MKQWIITTDTATDLGEILVTVYDSGHLVACKRLDHTRWDQPLPVRAVAA